MEILKKIIPNEWKKDFVHIKNKSKHEKEIRKTNIKRGSNGKKYVYALSDFVNKKCIFIHIPRAAGHSISSAIFGHSGGGHRTALQYRAIFGRKFWSFFKFSFVRNPYARLVSAYEYLKDGGHPAWKNNKEFAKEVISKYNDFSDFVLGWMKPDRSKWPVPHFYPQTHFLSINNRISVDYIGRVENIDKDFEELCRRINNERSLIKKNESKNNKRTVNSYYTKDNVIRRVKKIYKKDFSMIGYSESISEIKNN